MKIFDPDAWDEIEQEQQDRKVWDKVDYNLIKGNVI